VIQWEESVEAYETDWLLETAASPLGPWVPARECVEPHRHLARADANKRVMEVWLTVPAASPIQFQFYRLSVSLL